MIRGQILKLPLQIYGFLYFSGQNGTYYLEMDRNPMAPHWAVNGTDIMGTTNGVVIGAEFVVPFSSGSQVVIK